MRVRCGLGFGGRVGIEMKKDLSYAAIMAGALSGVMVRRLLGETIWGYIAGAMACLIGTTIALMIRSWWRKGGY